MTDRPRRETETHERSGGEDLSPEVRRSLESMVSLQAEIPEDAFTSQTLGVKRAGSGVAIDDDGLVLTIGYLVTEAETVWLTTQSGRLVPAHPLALDPESGFALVQALDRLGLPGVALGNSGEARRGDPVVIAAGGRRPAVSATIAAKREFAGYWEYLLDEAIFTAPAHPFWGGAGLFGADGRLLGVGSLHIEGTNEEGETQDVNMIVPIDLLSPALHQLRTKGRLDKPARPWLGVYSGESDGRVVVAGVADRSPAEAAGLRRGDIVIAVGETGIASLADFYRGVWARGSAGVEIPVEVVRDGRSLWLRVRSAERAAHFKRPRLH
ncbi:MAG: serine protease [Bradyrhizobium sp.]|nr:MAG: serine protease [Bradyrhizobium sp.]